MNKQTYILFKRSGQNVKNKGPLFEALDTFYGTEAEASKKLMGFAEEDHNAFVDEDGNLEGIMNKGDLSYEHDSRDYHYCAIENMSEEEAAVALRDNVLYSNDLIEQVYNMFEHLRPEVEDADGE